MDHLLSLSLRQIGFNLIYSFVQLLINLFRFKRIVSLLLSLLTSFTILHIFSDKSISYSNPFSAFFYDILTPFTYIFCLFLPRIGRALQTPLRMLKLLQLLQKLRGVKFILLMFSSFFENQSYSTKYLRSQFFKLVEPGLCLAGLCWLGSKLALFQFFKPSILILGAFTANFFYLTGLCEGSEAYLE